MDKPNVLNYSDADFAFEAKIREILPFLYSYDVIQIIERYNEPWRRYHNKSHILIMLDIVNEDVKGIVVTRIDSRWWLLAEPDLRDRSEEIDQLLCIEIRRHFPPVRKLVGGTSKKMLV